MTPANKIRHCLLGIAMYVGLLLPRAQAEPIVIVAAGSPVTALRSEQLADIFLGKINYFPGGGRAVPVDVPESDPLREAFYTTLIGKTMPQLRAYWSRQIFTGKGQPPIEGVSDEAVRKMVATHPGYIGYVDARAVDATVKAVVIKK